MGGHGSVFHACKGGMGPNVPGDCLQYEAVISGGDEESGPCDGDLGTNVPFGMEIPPDTRRMGMVLAER